jgi:Ca-activated chloride channel family protein
MIAIRVALIGVLAAASGLAQAPMRFTSGTAAVRVDVLVTAGNRPVIGLKASDFELRDNGVLQQIRDVSQETLPLNLFCVLDVSGSVDGQPLVRLKEATAALFGTLRDRDRAALMTFADRLVLHSPLTGDAQRLRALLDQMKAGGWTSFLDATYAGLALRESDDGRSLMLLFSDGDDTASWMRTQTVIEAIHRTDVVIYPVTIKRPAAPLVRTVTRIPGSTTVTMRIAAEQTPTRLLNELADASGGRLIYVESEEKLQTTFVQALSEFRQRYVLSYSPTNVSADGWHSVDVKVVRRRADVKARRGYAADTPSRGAATKEPEK